LKFCAMNWFGAEPENVTAGFFGAKGLFRRSAVLGCKDEEFEMSIQETAAKQAVGLGAGFLAGAASGVAKSSRSAVCNPRMPGTAIQVGQAAGAAMRNGAGVTGAAAASAAVLTAKAAAVGAVATAAAPVIATVAAVGAVGYLASRILKKL
jgi:hypothetical protein